MDELQQEQVEQIKEENTTELTEEQNALVLYQSHLNKFLNLLHSYPGASKDLRVAWGNAAIAPMNKDKFIFSYPEQQELFEVFNELNSVKFMLLVYSLVEQGKVKLLEPLMSSNNPINNSNELTNEGESNG